MGTHLEDDQPADVIETINEIAKGINAGETVVFCGAGISYNSGLPVVKQFSPYVLLTLCASREERPKIEGKLKGVQDTQGKSGGLIKKVCELAEVSEEAIRKVMDALPFEAFIETLDNYSDIDRIFDIYDADSYKPAVEPNANHTFLAKLVAAGKVKTIVTTNFDQLIEKALKSEGKIEQRDYDVLYREEEFQKIKWARDRIRLIKLHGSIHDKQAMAITLGKVAQKELSEGRANIIRHVYTQGNHKQVLILGYSCSDVFDLSPQIEALEGDMKGVFLVQHSGGRGVEDIRNREDKNPFKAFKKGKRLCLNTDDTVRALWESTLPDPYHVNKRDTAYWEEKVDGWHAESLQHRGEVSKHSILGQLFYAVAEWRTAIRCYERALASSREAHDKEGEGATLDSMGSAYRQLGEYRKAIDLYEKALEIARRIGNVQRVGNTLSGMGIAYANLGDYRKAIELLEKALEIHRRIGDVGNEGGTLGNIGSAYMQVGDYRKAIELHEKALEIHRRIGNVRGEEGNLCNMGTAYQHLGEYRKAIELHEKALEIARKIGDVRDEGAGLNNVGLAYDNLGEYRKAIELYEKALEIARKIGDVRGEGGALGNIGLAYDDLGEYRKAIELYEQHLEIARRIGDLQGEGNALCGLGRAYALIGMRDKTFECLGKSKTIFKGLGLQHMVATVEKMTQSIVAAAKIDDTDWPKITGPGLDSVRRHFSDTDVKKKLLPAWNHLVELRIGRPSKFLTDMAESKFGFLNLGNAARKIEIALKSKSGVPYIAPGDLQGKPHLRSLYAAFITALYEAAACAEVLAGLGGPVRPIEGKLGVQELWQQLEYFARGHEEEEWRIEIARSWRNRLDAHKKERQ
jgi:tetratricopeptide (TPR) repeat protein